MRRQKRIHCCTLILWGFSLHWRSWDFSNESRPIGQDYDAKAGQNVLTLQKVGVRFPRIMLKSKSTHGKTKLDNVLSDRHSNGLQSPAELGKMFRAPAPTFSSVVVEALLNIAIFSIFKIRWVALIKRVTKQVVTSAGFSPPALPANKGVLVEYMDSIPDVPIQSLPDFNLMFFLTCRSRERVRSTHTWGDAIKEHSSWSERRSFQFICLQFDLWVYSRSICMDRDFTRKDYKILALLSLEMWNWLKDLLPSSNISLLQERVSFYLKGGINPYHRHLFPALQQVKVSSLWWNKVSLSLKTLVMCVVFRLSLSGTGLIRLRNSKYLYPLPGSWLGISSKCSK